MQAQIYAPVNDVLAACREYVAAADAIHQGPMTQAAFQRCSAAEQALIAVVTAPNPVTARYTPRLTPVGAGDGDTYVVG